MIVERKDKEKLNIGIHCKIIYIFNYKNNLIYKNRPKDKGVKGKRKEMNKSL